LPSSDADAVPHLEQFEGVHGYGLQGALHVSAAGLVAGQMIVALGVYESRTEIVVDLVVDPVHRVLLYAGRDEPGDGDQHTGCAQRILKPGTLTAGGLRRRNRIASATTGVGTGWWTAPLESEVPCSGTPDKCPIVMGEVCAVVGLAESKPGVRRMLASLASLVPHCAGDHAAQHRRRPFRAAVPTRVNLRTCYLSAR
jgi:hypothetical protein